MCHDCDVKASRFMLAARAEAGWLSGGVSTAAGTAASAGQSSGCNAVEMALAGQVKVRSRKSCLSSWHTWNMVFAGL